MAELTVSHRVSNVVGNRKEEFGRFFLPDNATDGFVRTKIYRLEHVEIDPIAATGSAANSVYMNFSDAGTTTVNGTFFLRNMEDPGGDGITFSYHAIGR